MITVFTIVYNNYGEFLPQWIDNLKKQTVEPYKIIIVLGKDHGVDMEVVKEQLKGIKHSFIQKDSTVMGTLRNAAVKRAQTPWILYFSVDDILMPKAIEYIRAKSKNCDAIALKYFERGWDGNDTERQSAIYTKAELPRWQQLYPVPGYIAVKRKYKNKILYYEDIETPNYPYLFNMTKVGMRLEHSEYPCAVYVRRPHSHGDESIRSKKSKEFFIDLDARAKKIARVTEKDLLKQRIEKAKGTLSKPKILDIWTKGIKVMAKQSFYDTTIGKSRQWKEVFTVDEKRAQDLFKKGKIIKLEEKKND